MQEIHANLGLSNAAAEAEVKKAAQEATEAIRSQYESIGVSVTAAQPLAVIAIPDIVKVKDNPYPRYTRGKK